MTKESAEPNELVPFEIETEVGLITGLQRVEQESNPATDHPLTLVLHSAGGGARSLARMAQQLTVAGPLFIPDLNGYGLTRLVAEKAASLSAVDQHLLLISTLIDKLITPRQNVVLIGQSMGGFLCLKTAFTNTYPVKAIAVIEPVAFSVLDPVADASARAEDLDKVLALDTALKTGNPEKALGDFIGYWGQCDWAALPTSMREALCSQVEQIGAESLSIAQDDTPTEHYSHLQLPMLLVQGADTRPPAVSVVNRIAGLVPHAELKIIEGAGHMGAVQQPDDFATTINRFLKSTLDEH